VTGVGERLAYTGSTPFGTCFHQAVANVLQARGLDGAADRLGVSWGYAHRPDGGKLGSSQRWLGTVGRLSGMDIRRGGYPDVDTAMEAERAALGGGSAVVSTVDAYYIPSEYRSTRHIAHALIVAEHTGDDVVVMDAMNAPGAARMPVSLYRTARSADVADHAETILVSGSARWAYPWKAGLSALERDITAHAERDDAELDRFVAAVAGGFAPDVADVAAERYFTHRMFVAAARDLPVLKDHAEALDGLVRRWYFAHTVGAETAGASPRRMAAILRDIGERDRELRAETAALLRRNGLADPVLPAVRAIVEQQTGLSTMDDLWAAGMTSLASVRVMVAIEDTLDVEFPPEMLSRETFASTAVIAEAVDRLLARREEQGDGD
jgi:acyl carrier protein